jgi:hypothetical protein
MGESYLKHPASLAKLLALLAKTRATSVILLSGDVHMAEISRCSCPFLPPLYELTSSGMTHSWKGPREPLVRLISSGFRRIGDLYTDKNAGEVAVQMELNTTNIHLRILSKEGTIAKEHVVSAEELKMPTLSAAMEADVLACAASDPHIGLSPACSRLLQSCEQPSDDAVAKAKWQLVFLVTGVLAFLTALFSLPCALICGCTRSKTTRRIFFVVWSAAVAYAIQAARAG